MFIIRSGHAVCLFTVPIFLLFHPSWLAQCLSVAATLSWNCLTIVSCLKAGFAWSCKSWGELFFMSKSLVKLLKMAFGQRFGRFGIFMIIVKR